MVEIPANKLRQKWSHQLQYFFQGCFLDVCLSEESPYDSDTQPLSKKQDKRGHRNRLEMRNTYRDIRYVRFRGHT